jgi:O-antigen ligase
MATVGSRTGPSPRATVSTRLSVPAERVEQLAALAIRWAVYLALFLVPLTVASPDAMFGYADVPRVAMVRLLAAFVSIAWLVRLAASGSTAGSLLFTGSLSSPPGRLLLTAGAFLAVNLVSAVLSVSPSVSFAGAYPGFDAGDVYSMACYCLLGAAAAAHLKRPEHFAAVLWALAFAGGVASAYGVFQLLGLDPLDFDRFEVNSDRTPLTFGNPGFAGSFLVISLLATLGLFCMRRRVVSRHGVLLAFLIGLQVFGLAAAASRGSWAAAAAGSVVLAVLLYLTGSRPALSRLALAAVIAASAVAVVFVLDTDSTLNGASERAQSLNAGVVESGLNGRQSTWAATLEMISSRPRVDTDRSPQIVRHLVGYGPDTYRHAYQLVAPDEHSGTLVPHAHNAFLNTVAELGWAGATLWSAFVALALWTGIGLVRDSRNSHWARVMAAVLTAAVSARLIDQMANVPRASDTLAFWVLAGALGALAAVAHSARHGAAAGHSLGGAYDTAAGLARQQHPTEPHRPDHARAVLPLLLVAPAVAVIAGFTWLANVGHIRADVQAAHLQNQMRGGVPALDVVGVAGDAAGLAPDVPYYRTLQAMALESAADALPVGSLPERQLQAGALEAWQAAAAINPLSPVERLNYARALYTRGGPSRPELIDRAVAEYEVLVRLSPNNWAAWLEMAAAYSAAGRRSEGEAALARAAGLIERQATADQTDETTVLNFAAVHHQLGLPPGKYFP